MSEIEPTRRYRFGVFEADTVTCELRRQGIRIKLHTQPFQVLRMLLERPGEMLTREEICRELWPEGTFVDYEHGVNSAVNRLRDALGDKAGNPRFVETLARRGYRFVAPVERIGVGLAPSAPAAEALVQAAAAEQPSSGFLDRVLATAEDLPRESHVTARILFLLLQVMYVAFYVGALANLAEINELFAPLAYAAELFVGLIVTAALLIPVRTFLFSAVLFRAPSLRERYLRLWPYLLPFDLVWALAPFLLLHHINYGWRWLVRRCWCMRRLRNGHWC